MAIEKNNKKMGKIMDLNKNNNQTETDVLQRIEEEKAQV